MGAPKGRRRLPFASQAFGLALPRRQNRAEARGPRPIRAAQLPVHPRPGFGWRGQGRRRASCRHGCLCRQGWLHTRRVFVAHVRLRDANARNDRPSRPQDEPASLEVLVYSPPGFRTATSRQRLGHSPARRARRGGVDIGEQFDMPPGRQWRDERVSEQPVAGESPGDHGQRRRHRDGQAELGWVQLQPAGQLAGGANSAEP